MANVKIRKKIEKEIVSKVVECLLDKGYSISVYSDLSGSDEYLELELCNDKDKILSTMFSADEDCLHVIGDGKKHSWIQFIYGNDGYDVIHDYTVDLEEAIKPALELAHSYAD